MRTTQWYEPLDKDDPFIYLYVVEGQYYARHKLDKMTITRLKPEQVEEIKKLLEQETNLCLDEIIRKGVKPT